MATQPGEPVTKSYRFHCRPSIAFHSNPMTMRNTDSHIGAIMRLRRLLTLASFLAALVLPLLHGCARATPVDRKPTVSDNHAAANLQTAAATTQNAPQHSIADLPQRT